MALEYVNARVSAEGEQRLQAAYQEVRAQHCAQDEQSEAGGAALNFRDCTRARRVAVCARRVAISPSHTSINSRVSPSGRVSAASHARANHSSTCSPSCRFRGGNRASSRSRRVGAANLRTIRRAGNTRARRAAVSVRASSRSGAGGRAHTRRATVSASHASISSPSSRAGHTSARGRGRAALRLSAEGLIVGRSGGLLRRIGVINLAPTVGRAAGRAHISTSAGSGLGGVQLRQIHFRLRRAAFNTLRTRPAKHRINIPLGGLLLYRSFSRSVGRRVSRRTLRTSVRVRSALSRHGDRSARLGRL